MLNKESWNTSASGNEHKQFLERYQAHKQILSAPETPEHLQVEYRKYCNDASHTGHHLGSFEAFATNRENTRAKAVVELGRLIHTASDPSSTQRSYDEDYDQSSRLETLESQSESYLHCLGLNKNGPRYSYLNEERQTNTAKVQPSAQPS